MVKKCLCVFILLSFISAGITGPYPVYAEQELSLPVPGAMVNLSPAFEPVLIKGLKVHPDNPFLFDFIIDTGSDVSLRGAQGTKVLKEQSSKLIKYFLAAMTVPEKDLWVNLSPYEKDRMIAPNLGQTEMGRDMLAQDYILKQLTASLIYPEKDLGKTFWHEVYAQARQMYGTTQVPVNTFNKVWIVADKADVFERGNTAYVVGAHLKVMLEEDYQALTKHVALRGGEASPTAGNDSHSLASQVIRRIVLPKIEQEVNQGQNFAPLRQIFYSMILASWYKMALKDALLAQIYGNQGKVKVGINQDDPKANDEIFERYLKAYKKGVFNYIKDDIDQTTRQPVPRKYFSGGEDLAMLGNEEFLHRVTAIEQLPQEALEARGSLIDVTMAVAVKRRATAEEMLIEGLRRDVGRMEGYYNPEFKKKYAWIRDLSDTDLFYRFDAAVRNQQDWLACYYGLVLAKKYMTAVEKNLPTDIGMATAYATHLELHFAELLQIWSNASHSSVFPADILTNADPALDDAGFFTRTRAVFSAAFYRAKNLQSNIGGDSTEKSLKQDVAMLTEMKKEGLKIYFDRYFDKIFREGRADVHDPELLTHIRATIGFERVYPDELKAFFRAYPERWRALDKDENIWERISRDGAMQANANFNYPVNNVEYQATYKSRPETKVNIRVSTDAQGKIREAFIGSFGLTPKGVTNYSTGGSRLSADEKTMLLGILAQFGQQYPATFGEQLTAIVNKADRAMTDTPGGIKAWYQNVFVRGYNFLWSRMLSNQLTYTVLQTYIDQAIKPLEPNFRTSFPVPSGEFVGRLDLKNFFANVKWQVMVPRKFIVLSPNNKVEGFDIVSDEEIKTPMGRTIKSLLVARSGGREDMLTQAESDSRYVYLYIDAMDGIYDRANRDNLRIFANPNLRNEFFEAGTFKFPSDYDKMMRWVWAHYYGELQPQAFKERYKQTVYAEETRHVDLNNYMGQILGHQFSKERLDDVRQAMPLVIRQPNLRNVFNQRLLDTPPDVVAATMVEFEGKLGAMINSPYPCFNLMEMLIHRQDAPKGYEQTKGMLMDSLSYHLFGRTTRNTGDWLSELAKRMGDLNAFNNDIKKAAGTAYQALFYSAQERRHMLTARGINPDSDRSMVTMPSTVDLLGDIQKILREKGANHVEVILYGSYAQDGQKEGSDVDLMFKITDDITGLRQRHDLINHLEAVESALKEELIALGYPPAHVLSLNLTTRQDYFDEWVGSRFFRSNHYIWIISPGNIEGFKRDNGRIKPVDVSGYQYDRAMNSSIELGEPQMVEKFSRDIGRLSSQPDRIGVWTFSADHQRFMYFSGDYDPQHVMTHAVVLHVNAPEYTIGSQIRLDWFSMEMRAHDGRLSTIKVVPPTIANPQEMSSALLAFRGVKREDLPASIHSDEWEQYQREGVILLARLLLKSLGEEGTKGVSLYCPDNLLGFTPSSGNMIKEIAELKLPSDNAQTANFMAENGGIDLSQSNLNISREGQGVSMQFDSALIARIKREGFDGVDFHIESIVPVADVSLFLGLKNSGR